MVAETTEGPVVIAREGARAEPKQVVIGFHPGRGSMKYELATPLLIANILRWMVPGAFRRWEFQAGTVGTVNVPLEASAKPEDIKVLDEANRGLPFTVEDNNLRFFSGAPGTVPASSLSSSNTATVLKDFFICLVSQKFSRQLSRPCKVFSPITHHASRITFPIP